MTKKRNMIDRVLEAGIPLEDVTLMRDGDKIIGARFNMEWDSEKFRKYWKIYDNKVLHRCNY